MERVVQVLSIAEGVAYPDRQFTVQAEGLDELAAAARQSLVALGHRVRCVSFTPTGLVAYVERAQ